MVVTMELCTPSFDQSSNCNKRNGQTNSAALRDESLKWNLSFALLRCCTANLTSAYTQKLSAAGRYCSASCSLLSTCSPLQREWGFPTFWQHKEPQSTISLLSFSWAYTGLWPEAGSLNTSLVQVAPLRSCLFQKVFIPPLNLSIV